MELDLQSTLKSIQLRLSVLAGRQLTHQEIAKIAGVKVRSLGEWMRGTTSPASGRALLRLLSALPTSDVPAVLEMWKKGNVTDLSSREAESLGKLKSTETKKTRKRKKEI